MLERILIIDTASDIRELINYCISRTWPGAEIEVYDPARGRPGPGFDWHRYDLLLLEYNLGLSGQNGFEWLRDIKSHPEAPPVILLTTYGSEEIAVKAIRLGADYYFNKYNLSPKRFNDCVAELLKARSRTADESPEKSAHGVSLAARKMQESVADKLVAVSAGSLVAGKLEMGSLSHAGTRAFNYGGQPKRVPTFSPTVHPAVRVPGYDGLCLIAKGGMATIYLAKRDGDGFPVILKVLPINEKDNPALLKRFMREYTLLGKLNHPHVARIYERGFASNFAYIAMEYFPAGDLRAQLANDPIPGSRALRYLRQMAQGLGAIHALDIIHRDMKPANILFRDDDTLAITDFGVAKSLMVKEVLTQDNTFIGTLYYISPEQIRNQQTTSRSDFYSLGVILFEMLMGNKPFYGRSPSELFHAHLNAPIPRLPAKLAAFQPLLDGLLAKDPDDRFQSTEDLLMGLEWIEQSNPSV
jgi:DNA-binding response OmpR family regulator/tRNA A-37 threonylcarbamoyl transferase component Bud32